MQQNFSESVKPRAETFSRSAIDCITTKCTPEEIVPQGRRTPHMRGIFPHPDRGGAPRRGKGSKISLKKLSVRQNRRRRKRCPAARRRPLGRHRRQPLPGSTQRSARALSPAHLPGQHAAAHSGGIAANPFRAALSAPLGLHRRHTSRGCTPPPPPSGGRTPTYSAMAWR